MILNCLLIYSEGICFNSLIEKQSKQNNNDGDRFSGTKMTAKKKKKTEKKIIAGMWTK